jgi:hypothetical protein
MPELASPLMSSASTPVRAVRVLTASTTLSRDCPRDGDDLDALGPGISRVAAGGDAGDGVVLPLK